MRPPRSLQDLPPRWAHFCLGIERFVRQDLLGAESGGGLSDHLDVFSGTLVAACSGGADSTALVLILNCLTRRHGGQVVVAHLDHGLRPESVDDARFVAGLCGDLGLECAQERADVRALSAEHGTGLEEAGRTARYDFLERLRRERGGSFICTAHHLNDLAEDVLLRLSRGAGWPGLGGLPGFDAERRLLRPLILTPKVNTLELLRDVRVAWREDASNALNSAARNRMRHQLLPLFLRENPRFLESVARLWRQARTDESFWQERIREVGGEPREGGCFFSLQRLRALHPAVRLRLFKAALDALGPGQVLSDSLHALDDAVVAERRAVVQFSGFKIARVDAEGVWFGPDPRADLPFDGGDASEG